MKMAKDETLLRFEMGRLEIEPTKPKQSSNKENPFVPHYSTRSVIKKNVIHKCSCSLQRKHTTIGINKNKSNRILKEPVLKILKGENGSAKLGSKCKNTPNGHFQMNVSSKSLCSDTMGLCALVQNCNQLKISSGSKHESTKMINANKGVHWWRNNISKTQDKESNQRNQTSTCSQQALNPPCDVTIDELASYFETFVHIPKKMSSMAEMMYI